MSMDIRCRHRSSVTTQRDLTWTTTTCLLLKILFADMTDLTASHYVKQFIITITLTQNELNCQSPTKTTDKLLMPQLRQKTEKI